MLQQKTHIIIVGGGLAGLAAATALAERNFRITLLESRPRLGGRASSIYDQQAETWIDNCQHVSMGCCTNYQHFCNTLGISKFFRKEPSLYFIDEQNQLSRFESTWLPAPLHLLPAFYKLKHFSNSDRHCLARGIKALARIRESDSSDKSFVDWLHAQQQSEKVIDAFWQVILVSALSESLDRINIAAARKVIVDGFLKNRNGWMVQIPTKPLDQLYGENVSRWLAERDVEIRMKTGAQQLLCDKNRIVGVQLKSGDQIHAEEFVLAVPFQLVHTLLPESLTSEPALQRVTMLQAAPISSVHFWFDAEVTELPHAVLINRLSQWMFNRTRLAGEHDNAQQYYYQVVISASREVTQRPSQEVIDTVLEELKSLWPKTGSAKLIHARLITEHHAVFSMLPGVSEYRPPQQSSAVNLQLAGDWTRTGWPATMEGAVRSGYLAAENILARYNQSDRLLQPDLPTSWLSKFLFGL